MKLTPAAANLYVAAHDRSDRAKRRAFATDIRAALAHDKGEAIKDLLRILGDDK